MPTDLQNFDAACHFEFHVLVDLETPGLGAAAVGGAAEPRTSRALSPLGPLPGATHLRS